MLIYWIIKIALWALAGLIASKLMKGEPSGLLGNIILGLIGGVVGSFLFSLLRLGTSGIVWEIIVSVIGACAVIWLARKLNIGKFFSK
uniref:GlsB/YeaQ/YmgE family stress response membrane protein n=1 Tax=uncultured bacterium Contig21 TaxID=1393535 RepID=W0FJ60_9BACT|nr:hypothetical protein [uncultured bacterium Contig21]